MTKNFEDVTPKNSPFCNNQNENELFKDNDVWRPDARYFTRREVNRRKAEDMQLAASSNVVNIDIFRIRPNRSQPRVHFESNATIRLADSIRRYGILQPLTVRIICTENSGGEEIIYENNTFFEIIAGERRFRAAKILGMKSVPCIIISADDKKSAELALIENLLREDLNIFETARAIKKLVDDFKLTQEEVAKKLSMSQSAVANKLRLLKYTEKEEEIILKNHLTERHARALLKITDPTERIDILKIIISAHMNVSATESYVEKFLNSDNTEEIPLHSRKLPIIKDIRIFYNSIDKALDIVKSAGVEIFSKRREDDNGVTIEINIPNPRKHQNVSRETF